MAGGINPFVYVDNGPISAIDPAGLIKILTIHSNVSTNGKMAGGHAWISYRDTDAGVYQTFGLYPDAHTYVKITERDNGPGSDVRSNIEIDLEDKFSESFTLTDDQYFLLGIYLDAYAQWGYLYNCASWASDLIEYVLEEQISASDPCSGIDTPRGISNSIKNRKKKGWW